MVGEIQPAVFVVVVDLLVLVVFDLSIGVFFPFWGDVLQGQTLIEPLAHLNLFYYYFYSSIHQAEEQMRAVGANECLDMKVQS